jgi:hypothetical protein
VGRPYIVSSHTVVPSRSNNVYSYVLIIVLSARHQAVPSRRPRQVLLRTNTPSSAPSSSPVGAPPSSPVETPATSHAGKQPRRDAGSCWHATTKQPRRDAYDESWCCCQRTQLGTVTADESCREQARPARRSRRVLLARRSLAAPSRCPRQAPLLSKSRWRVTRQPRRGSTGKS